MESLGIRDVRRLALAKAGLLKPEWTGMPTRVRRNGKSAREAAHKIIQRFGYLQLDTVSIAGARSHTIVLLSRLKGFDPALGEALLNADAPLFEYWGHEACWIPMELYSAFGFRRREFRHHPWWGNIVGNHPDVARRLRRRIRDFGPIRSIEMEGQGSSGWWDLKIAKKVATALWSSGELAILERKNFQRTYDLASRVIPQHVRDRRMTPAAGLDALLLKALDGHGWATTGTMAATWRLRNRKEKIKASLGRLIREGHIVPCELRDAKQRPVSGFVQPHDLQLAARLSTVRPRKDQGVLLSPFDPVLWDRARVARLFNFDQVLEIFKPAPKRTYGYYCLPVLAGDRLVSRVDLKADRKNGRLHVISCQFEDKSSNRSQTAPDREATRLALKRYATSLNLEIHNI